MSGGEGAGAPQVGGPGGGAEFQYVTGQGRPTFAALLDGYRAACSQAESLEGWSWDVPYGPRPRQVMDVRPASAPRRGSVIYLHAGYWQSRDKSMFRFLAPPLNEAGFDVVLANYPLCPDMALSGVVDAVCELPEALASVLPSARDGLPVLAVGHSAGAHLAAEMVLRERTAATGMPTISGVLGISGVYDLDPLLKTSLNAKLRLDGASAERLSVVRHLSGSLPPGAFVAGGQETFAFLQQTENMAKAWGRHGACRHATAAGDDHFSILRSLIEPGGLLLSLLLELARPS